MKTKMNIALKGIGMIVIASSIFFTACDDTKTGEDRTGIDTIQTAPVPIDTISGDTNVPVDTAKTAPIDSIKK